MGPGAQLRAAAGWAQNEKRASSPGDQETLFEKRVMALPRTVDEPDSMIGVVGGVGPYAGLDLVRKIFDQTQAGSDQEHLPVALLSLSQAIEDRTSFLLGHTSVNPAFAVARIVRRLETLGAGVVGIPCNSVHAPRIYDVICEELRRASSSVKLVHMILEVAEFTRQNYPGISTVGVLSTTGVCQTGIYPDTLARRGIHAVIPDRVVQESVHRAIYDPDYGIKRQSNPVTTTARGWLLRAIDHLHNEGAEAVILGCTEIPLAFAEQVVGRVPLIDPNLILARALIREASPGKLKPLQTREGMPASA